MHWFDSDIEFTGIPFMVVGSKVPDCHHGRDRHLKRKESTKGRKEEVRRIMYKHGRCYLFLLFISYNLFVKY